VTDTLIDRTANMIASSDFKFKNIVICGGVSANIYIRKRLEKAFPEHKIYYAPLHLCTDNATMIANIGKMKSPLI
jgi:N6-L-threonylcarbamoyladenine synthase